jgi:hypothetical protein
MAEPWPGRRHRCGSGRRDRLAPRPPGQRPAAAAAGGCRSRSPTGRARTGRGPASARTGGTAAGCLQAGRTPRSPAGRSQCAPGARTPETFATAPWSPGPRSGPVTRDAPASGVRVAGLPACSAAVVRGVPVRALVPEVSRSQSKTGLRFGAQVAVEGLGGGEDVHAHPTGPLQRVMEQAPGDAAAAPLLADKQRREVGLDLAIGLQLDEARKRSIDDRDERGGPGCAQRAVGAFRVLRVGVPAGGGAEGDAAIEVLALECPYVRRLDG